MYRRLREDEGRADARVIDERLHRACGRADGAGARGRAQHEDGKPELQHKLLLL